MNILIVVDMQNDFIDGSLGTKEAVAILPNVIRKIKDFKINNNDILFTRDTHQTDYLSTVEGTHLPVPHCIEGTEGWNISSQLTNFIESEIINKTTFGSKDLPSKIQERLTKENHSQEDLVLTLIGLCTDICVISNAIVLKTFFPESTIIVDESCCAGVTPQTHKNALEALKMCHIIIENERS